MSLISSYFIEPVVRAGRRLSFGTGAAPVPPASNAAPAEPLSHANQVSSSTAPPQNGGAEADSEALAARDAPQSPDGRPAHLLERIRRYSSFTRRPNDVVVDEELEMGDDEGAISATTTTTTTATAPIAIPSDATNMSANPSRPLEHRLRSLDLDPPVSSAPAASTAVAGAGVPATTSPSTCSGVPSAVRPRSWTATGGPVRRVRPRTCRRRARPSRRRAAGSR